MSEAETAELKVLLAQARQVADELESRLAQAGIESGEVEETEGVEEVSESPVRVVTHTPPYTFAALLASRRFQVLIIAFIFVASIVGSAYIKGGLANALETLASCMGMMLAYVLFFGW